MNPATYSIVIPVHNEFKNLTGRFKAFIKWMNTKGGEVFSGLKNVEIVFAEDGSTDGTPELLASLSKDFLCSVQVLHAPNRLGKGGGFKAGFLRARNDVVILYDSDLSVSPGQLANLVGAMKGDVDVVIGCRNAPGSRILTFPSLTRFFYGKALYLLAKFLFFIPFKETQCGFKAFDRKRLVPIIKQMALTGWLFDLELLLRAYYYKFKMEEIPVVYRYFKASKIHNIKDPIKVFFDLVRLRARILHYYLILPGWSKKLLRWKDPSRRQLTR